MSSPTPTPEPALDLGTRESAEVVVLPRPPRRRSVRAAEVSLDTTQRWFLDAITHPGSVGAGARAAGRKHGVGASRLLTDGPVLGHLSRLEVYHYAYRARLRECLADDFAAVREWIGADRFDRLCDRVITAAPSRTKDLNVYGRALVDHLARRPSMVAELAALEWALVEAIHAAPPELLDPAELARVSMEAWVNARFSPSPTLRVLAFAYPVNGVLQALREGRRPRRPGRRPTWVAVYRKGFVVWRMEVPGDLAEVLARLVDGASLGEALAVLPEDADPGRVMHWFSTFVAEGLFSAVRID